jgi:hypothetical protein
MPPGDNQQNDHPSDTRPFLCVPYWTSPLTSGGLWDTGESRPLPGAVISYACESVHTSTYKPGTLLDVTVNVRNSGGGSITPLVTVVVYWAVPTVGFAKPTFFAASVVPVPPSRTSPGSVSTSTMTAMIPATAPDHICLVVSVSHAQDPAGVVCDPINDRHWAQHNLQAVSVVVGAPTIFPIVVANPFEKPNSFELRVGAVDERRAHHLATLFQTTLSGVRPQLRLLDEHGASISSGETVQVPVDLGALQEKPFQLLVELDTELPPGQSTAIEAVTSRSGQNSQAVGSLGVVLLGALPR